MEDYRLEQSGQQVQDILNGAAMQVDLTAETERATKAEQTLDGKIDTEKGRIDALEEKIPSGASSSNKLATEEYVDDSVATATATFRGTFNLVSDLDLTVDATEQQIAAALAGAISTADNNDYAFVLIPTSDETPTEIAEIDRYKFNGTAWAFEYALNNSGFTAAEWAAINSGITSELVTKLGNLPTAAALAEALASKQNVLTFDSVPTEGSNNPVKSGGVYSAIDDEKGARLNSDAALQQAIEAILLLIPSAASSLNQLADKAFVNSSIATNTATFRGTFNIVNDLHLTLAATHAEIGTALASAISDEDNNDYCFVQIPTSATSPTEIAQTDRYKFNGSTWEYEYTLNNSGFTSAQWTAINSGITSALVSKLSALPTNSELTTDLGTLSAAITAINQKIPAAAAQNNKLVDTVALESYIVQVLGVLTVSYNITSMDGHVTLAIQQTDGKITSVSLTTSDIASAAALNLKASQADLTALASRVTTADGNITTLNGNLTSLTGRVSTNETDIAQLQAAYEALTQSDIIIGALPASGVANKIYRVPGTNSYSDYMWNGSTWVLMATYNNAIDPRPKKASLNLVTSGGIFDNMGALDISELNATENPHTLATYADLSAALAAIPSNDYKKGGMSVKFVQSSDNKYMQARCMAQNFTTDVTQWQGIDAIPTDNSKNLVESGGVKEIVSKFIKQKSDISQADLSIGDDDGNALLQLYGGNIKTKNFDSGKLKIETANSFSDADFNLGDSNGNVLVSFEDGGIKTKNFDSSKISKPFNNIALALSAKKNVTNDINNNDYEHLATIVHISDLHGGTENTKRAFEVAKILNATVVCTGDIVEIESDNSIDFFSKEVINYEGKVILCVGNHDTWRLTSENATYTKYYQPFATQKGWTMDNSVNHPTYFYYDDTTYKIRYISINQWQADGKSFHYYFYYTQQQIDFIISALSTLPSGYGVIIAIHSPEETPVKNNSYTKFFQDIIPFTNRTWLTYAPIKEIVDAFIGKSTLNKTFTNNENSTSITVNADFSSVLSNEFIAFMNGHFHSDLITYNQGVQNRELSLNVTTSNYTLVYSNGTKSGSRYSDLGRQHDSTNIDAFNVYVIDRVNRSVRIVRIGADLPCTLQEKRDFMSIIY